MRNVLYDRREKIIALLNRDGIVKANELVEQYGVSRETIRRDLEYLEKRGLVDRVYGGAILRKKRGVEPKIEKRQLEHYEEKKAIGQRAVDLVEDGEVIAIDLGTTTREFARALVGKKRRLTVITNSIPIALDLSVDENIRVIMVGGEVRKNELSVSGNIADENMRYFQTDKIFLGVGGLTEKFGITDYHVEETPFRRIGVSRTQKVIALADHSKFGVTAMNQVCSLEQIDALVTDRQADKNLIGRLKAKGMKVYLA